jgi:outer membrane protein assembly factor BamB
MIGQPLSELKRKNALLWSLRVGRMHSRNNIQVRGNRAFLSTSGSHWNRPDDRDGVYCVDLSSGTEVWFTPTHADANEIALIGNSLLVGTDAGKAFAIDTDSGEILSSITLQSPIYVRAIELEVNRTALLISRSGEVCIYSHGNKNFVVLGAIPHAIRANPLRITSSSFLVGSERGTAVLVRLEAKKIECRTIFQIEPHKASGAYEFNLQIKGISSIVISGDQVILSYVRDTYDRRPPMVCFSLTTGQKLWDAGRVQSASKSERQEFGNSRVVPAIWNDLVITTFSYNDSVHAFSLQSGKWMWRLRLDDSYFQNWSSPVVHEDRLYVARINGVLSIIDLRLRTLLASYSVEVFDVAGKADQEIQLRDGREAWPNSISGLDSSGPDPGQELVAGICSTPAVLNDRILVGTVSGNLCCLRQLQMPGP